MSCTHSLRIRTFRTAASTPTRELLRRTAFLACSAVEGLSPDWRMVSQLALLGRRRASTSACEDDTRQNARVGGGGGGVQSNVYSIFSVFSMAAPGRATNFWNAWQRDEWLTMRL